MKVGRLLTYRYKGYNRNSEFDWADRGWGDLLRRSKYFAQLSLNTRR